MKYNGIKEDQRLISATPSERQIVYQNMEYFVLFILLLILLQEVNGDWEMSLNQFLTQKS